MLHCKQHANLTRKAIASMKPASKASRTQEDHRSRVGAERREKTRQLLLESAVVVFAQKGPDDAQIEDFIATAGVARGTFYNYFSTTTELLSAVSGHMSDEVLHAVDPVVQSETDPAARLATGTRLYMELACRYPLWGAFITRVGARAASRGKLLDICINRDVELGLAAGRFKGANALVIRDMVLGSIFYGIETVLTEQTRDFHAEELVAAFLRGIGLSEEEARAISLRPLPSVGPVQGTLFSTLKPTLKRRRTTQSPRMGVASRTARETVVRGRATARA